jgi:hypothetical protein
MRLLTVFLIISFITPAFSQSGQAKRALRALAEKDLEKASELIIKGLEKDSADALIYYDIARYQIVKDNPSTDSANISEQKARILYDSLDADEREKYAKNGFTFVSLDLLRTQIDSVAFAEAEEMNSEASYNYFLDNYLNAIQREEARNRRNSIAYAGAREINTYKSYRDFMEKYPDAPQIELATERYERLFFEESIADGKLQSYEDFLKRNPSTPYREGIEYTILQMSGAFPDAEILTRLAERFRGRPAGHHARNFLFYHQQDLGRQWNDSLRIARQKNSETWVAAYQKDRVNFIDEHGQEKFSIDSDMLSPAYKCEVLTSDVIIGNGTIYSRHGDEVFIGDFDHAEPLENGYVLLESDDLKGLITTWGLTILPVSFDEIDILSSGLIKALRNGKWQIFTYSGRELSSPVFNDIQIIEGIHFFRRGEQEGIIPYSWFTTKNKGEDIPYPEFYDDYEIISDNRIWFRDGDEEFLTDRDANILIEPYFQRIEVLLPGYLIRRPDETIIRDTTLYQKYSTQEKLIDFNDYYVRFKLTETEGLFDFGAFRFIALPDSAELIGENGVIAFLGNQSAIYQQGKELVKYNGKPEHWQVIGDGGNEWILVHDRNTYLATDEGLKRLPAFNDISLVADSIFVLENRGKRALFHAKHGEILPFRYDGIGNFDGRDLSVLRNGKFGVYRPGAEIMIEPEFEKILQSYGESYFVAVKKDRKGLIGLNGDVHIPFEYQDIFYWSDSLALVHHDGTYAFHEIGGNYREEPILTSVGFLPSRPEEKLLRGFREGHFGIYSSTRGEILPHEFDDIINIGTHENPVYFTETYVEQADLHVVVYYDAAGNILKREALDPEVFNSILCE